MTGKGAGIYITRCAVMISAICAATFQVQKRTVRDANILSRKKRTDNSMGKGKVRKKKKARGTCETCSNAVYCGEGSHFCMESKEGPKCVMDDWGPAEDYFWCGGRKYEE